VASEARPVGRCASYDNRAPHRQRSVIVGYFEDGPNLVTLAMNGWADGEPAWWLNLQAHPDATVDLVNGSRAVRARAAEGAERSRLCASWRDIDRQRDAMRLCGRPILRS
jgi:F420H(2)-dependent quinone reductase